MAKMLSHVTFYRSLNTPREERCKYVLTTEEMLKKIARAGSASGFRNLGTSSRAVVRFYNKGGTAEQWINEGKQAVAMTRLSCRRFHANEVRL